MAKSRNNWIMTGVVIAGIIAVGIKFREKIFELSEKVGIPLREYLN